MKKLILSGAAANEYKPPNPDRTARRNVGTGAMDFDVEFKEWPSRESLMKVIHEQDKRERRRGDWVPVVKEKPYLTPENKLSSALDAVADSLESKGLIKEAAEVDVISNTLEAMEKGA